MSQLLVSCLLKTSEFYKISLRLVDTGVAPTKVILSYTVLLIFALLKDRLQHKAKLVGILQMKHHSLYSKMHFKETAYDQWPHYSQLLQYFTSAAHWYRRSIWLNFNANMACLAYADELFGICS